MSACAAAVPTIDEMLSYMKIDPAERAGILSGKIVSREVGEGSKNELAIGMVMFVPVPLDKIVGAVKTETLLGKDPEVHAYGEMFFTETRAPPPPKIYGPKDADEVDNLLDAGPGSQFNLDHSEIDAFHQLQANIRDPSKRPEEASKLYWQLARKRFEAYFKGGLAAAAPYDRGDGDRAKPGEELTLALKESKMLAKYFPELQKTLLEFPRSQLEGMVHRFFWINHKIEDRPTLILSHRVKYIRPEGALLVERQYYAGHSYNSMQILAGCIPTQGGTIVFYSNRTFTDQVAGFASGMKHSIGRGQMRDEIVKGFQEIRAAAAQ